MAQLTLGPIPFHWSVERKLDFYARIADEAPIDTVYLGEVLCSKRAPFFAPHLLDVAHRLQRGGKRVVLSSLAEVMLPRERQMTADLCAGAEFEVEANDGAALFHLAGKPHRVGPMMNVYNGETLIHLARRGATHVCLPVELPGRSAAVLAKQANERGVAVEVQVFGRASLAISARCYHARAHGRVKDNCQFVCEEDPDGMELTTLDSKPLLTINGIQTMSHTYISLHAEISDILAMGIVHWRLMPQAVDMVAVSNVFRDLCDEHIDADAAESRLKAIIGATPLSNGFWHGVPGHSYAVRHGAATRPA